MGGRITDDLRRITREQGRRHGGDRASLEAGEGRDEPGAASGRAGRAGPGVRAVGVAVALAVLAGGGFWLVRTLQADTKLQDCVMSGRKNCSGVEAP